MAKWWELAIPAASALGGVLVTSAVGLLVSLGQRRHEQKMRLLDEKRAAYTRFPAVMYDYVKEEGTAAPDAEPNAARRDQLLTELRDSFSFIELLGSKEVRAAADNVMNALFRDPIDISAVGAVRRAFTDAARQDIGVTSRLAQAMATYACLLSP